MNEKHFIYLFWFCVGVFTVSFIAMVGLIYIPFPIEHRDMASNTQGFLQGSLIMSAVGFLLTGSISSSNKKIPIDGKTTTELNLTATTVTEEPKPKENENNG